MWRCYRCIISRAILPAPPSPDCSNFWKQDVNIPKAQSGSHKGWNRMTNSMLLSLFFQFKDCLQRVIALCLALHKTYSFSSSTEKWLNRRWLAFAVFSFLMLSCPFVAYLGKWPQNTLLSRGHLPQKPIIKAISEKLLLLGTSGRLSLEAKHITVAAAWPPLVNLFQLPAIFKGFFFKESSPE